MESMILKEDVGFASLQGKEFASRPPMPERVSCTLHPRASLRQLTATTGGSECASRALFGKRLLEEIARIQCTLYAALC